MQAHCSQGSLSVTQTKIANCRFATDRQTHDHIKYDELWNIATGIEMDTVEGQLVTYALGPSTQLESLQEENTQLREDLEDCKARIIELNREDNKFADDEARTKFRHLNSCIEDWLNDFLDRGGKYIAWEKSAHPESYAKRYKSVGIPSDFFPLLPEAPDLYSAITWLSEKQCCDRFMLSLVTWRFLDRFIFRGTLPLGTGTGDRLSKTKQLLSDGDIPFVDSVHKVLAGVDKDSSESKRLLQSSCKYANAVIRPYPSS